VELKQAAGMNREVRIAILMTVLCCGIAGADPVPRGPPTTAQHLSWLTEVQSRVDARQSLRRKYPEVKLVSVGFSECVDFLRDAAVPNLIFDANAIVSLGVKQSTPITLTRLNTPSADLLQLVLDQADPVQHRIHYAVKDEFIFISTAEGVQRLDDFERRCRPPSHDFSNVLNRRILTQRTPMDLVSDDGIDNYQSMQLNDTDVVSAVRAISMRVGVSIDVDGRK
jgi:hypothetical protein